MRVVLSTTVQAHTFDVARELQRRGWLAALFTGYPRSRMAAKGLSGPEVRCFPIPVLAGMLMNRLVRSPLCLIRAEELWTGQFGFDKYDPWMGCQEVACA